MQKMALMLFSFGLGACAKAAVPVAMAEAAPATAAALTQSAWPTFKGDNARSGRALSQLTLPIQVKWRVRLRSSLYSSPVVVGEKVYLGSSSKHVYCLDLQTGKTLWDQEIPARIWGSTPTVDKGHVYVGAVDGCVYSLAAATGEIVRTYCAQKSNFLGSADVLSSPLVDEGRLFFGSDNEDIYAWELGSQSALWHFTTGDILHDNSASSISGTTYMSSRDGYAYALDSATGALRWKSAKAAKAYNTAPALDENHAYFSGGDGNLHVLNRATGKEVWRFSTGRIMMSSPALDGRGKIVLGSGDKNIYALNAADGKELWKFSTGGGVLSSPLITGDLVWVGSFDKNIYALEMASGKKVWSAGLNGGVFTSPACVGNLVLAAGRDGELACFEATFATSQSVTAAVQ